MVESGDRCPAERLEPGFAASSSLAKSQLTLAAQVSAFRYMLTSQHPKGPEKQGLGFMLQFLVENIPTFYITTSLWTQ